MGASSASGPMAFRMIDYVFEASGDNCSTLDHSIMKGILTALSEVMPAKPFNNFNMKVVDPGLQVKRVQIPSSQK